MSAEMLGDEFKLYYDTASSWASPTWVEQTSVGSLGLDPDFEAVEIPKRIPSKVYRGGRIDWRLTFTMNYDPTNTFHVAVRNAIRAKTKIHLAVGEGAIPTTDYVHGWWLLKGGTDASLDEAATIEVEGMPHHDIGTGDTEYPTAVN